MSKEEAEEFFMQLEDDDSKVDDIVDLVEFTEEIKKLKDKLLQG